MDINESGKVGRRSVIIGSAALMAAGIGTVPAEAAVRPKRRVDFARWDPITDRSTAVLAPKRVVMHIADTTARDIYGPGKGPSNSYAHFYNRRSGPPLQHQWLNRQAAAELGGSTSSISVEHQGVDGDSMTESQLTFLARIFAWSHVHLAVPNRIATPRNTTGLAWHRLGVAGEFYPFDRNDRKTWSRRDTGEVWSSVVKECPTDAFIDQIDDVFRIAQIWIRLYAGE